ncbi:MAG: peptidyl-prolyl cis-trans isomerase [Acidobacteria bacterium]|nr:peptidyl-prolyl cis-trans isomerase [Acidobacteriota bacterium]
MLKYLQFSKRVPCRLVFGVALILLSAGAVLGQKKEAKPMVKIETSLGSMVAELDSEKAPETVKNFLAYVDDKFYDGTIFHRVIKNFMIQGGGFTADMKRKPTRAPITNEAKNGLKNKRGTLAMARTGDPHSATSQFFINHKHNAFLDYPGQDGWGYAVYGKVVSGEDVLDKIASVSTASKAGNDDVPVTPVLIKSITRVDPAQNK